MLKIIRKQLDIDNVKLSLILALMFCVLFNISVAFERFDRNTASLLSVIIEITKELACVYIAIFVFFFGCSINKTLLLIGTIILFLTGSLASYCLFMLNISPTLKMMPKIFNADIDAIKQILDVRLVAWMLFSIFASLYALKFYGKHESKLFLSKILSGICLVLVVSNIVSPSFKILSEYFPLQYLNNAYIYIVS